MGCWCGGQDLEDQRGRKSLSRGICRGAAGRQIIWGGGYANPPADTVLCQLTHDATAEKRGSVGGTDGKRRERGRDATAALTRACRLGGQVISWTHTAEGLNEVHCCLRKLICLWTPMRQESSSNKEEGVRGALDEQKKSEKAIKREKREKNTDLPQRRYYDSISPVRLTSALGWWDICVPHRKKRGASYETLTSCMMGIPRGIEKRGQVLIRWSRSDPD